jgi:phosphoenolpyruvate synthase/pyruvate phosphate dikinase
MECRLGGRRLARQTIRDLERGLMSVSIGAPSYAQFCDVGGLRDRIEERLSSVNVEDTAELHRATREVREIVEAEPVFDRARRLIAAAERRVLLDAARSAG